MADVDDRMEAWAEEIGVWAPSQVMTMIARVMEMVARLLRSPEVLETFRWHQGS